VLFDVLINSGLGCHVDGIRVGFMMYTDDMLLMSESLQLMIDVWCSEKKLGLTFNSNECHVI